MLLALIFGLDRSVCSATRFAGSESWGVIRDDGIALHEAEEAGNCTADSARKKQLLIFIS